MSPSFTFLLIACIMVLTKALLKRPHIIFILADDMGWNDVSFHGSFQIPTPNIDALASAGIVLNKHYTAPQCTPSRASLMTGRYPSNTGLQHFVLLPGQPSGLPLNFTILPQHLKNLGYATHMIGKWNLGFYKKEYTPTYRGFDTFFGLWNGAMDYYDYVECSPEGMCGIDLHDGMNTIKDFRGKYSTELFTEKAEEVIRKHHISQPLFLLFSPNAPHTGSIGQRLQAPPEYVNKFMHIKDIKRRMYAGAVSALDESVGKVFSALHAKDMLLNSVVVFVSDNGPEVEGQRGGHGSNWPLRGCKLRLWEGGVRTPALIWSPVFRLQQPRISKEMIHASDWLPTLYTAAGGSVRDLGNIDGVNMWNHLVWDLPSPRNEILLNVDPISGMSALIQNDYKLLNGTYTVDSWELWYGPSGREGLNISSMDEWVWRNGSVVKNILQSIGRWLIKEPDSWRQGMTIDCGASSVPVGDGICDPLASPCLFNITEDPCEYRNLAPELPQVVEDMMNRIQQLRKTSLEPLNPETDINADPRCHDFTFVPWRDPMHASKPCYKL